MKKFFIIFFLLLFSFAYSADDTVLIELQVSTGASSTCNNNGICETGENSSNCSLDCGCNNNGTCEASRGEDASNCASDCYVPPVTPTSTPIVIIYDDDPAEIENVKISDLTINSVRITWTTSEDAYCSFYLGETGDYEQEIVVEDVFSIDHSIFMSNLISDRGYNFKIFCWDKDLLESESKSYTFSTLPLPDTIPPSNVSNLQIKELDSKLILSWDNPNDDDFSEVRIMRSETFYPDSPFDGYPIFTGDREKFEDLAVLNNHTYYYTIFAYDYSGNYSSGAIIFGTPFKKTDKPPKPGDPDVIIPDKPKPPVKPPVVIPPAEVQILTLDDFNYYQGSKELGVVNKSIKINQREPLLVSIDYEKVPEVLKTIMVTLESNNRYFSFLLRINQEKTNYSATIMPPDPGIYPLDIHVLDYENQNLRSIHGFLRVLGIRFTGNKIIITNYNFIYFVLILLIIIFILLRIKNRRKKQ